MGLPSGAFPPELDARPTRVRFLVVALTMLASLLLYLDRFCISFAERYIKDDLGLSNAQVSWLLGAFFWTYALAQVPSGFLSDRYGPRRMLTLYILLWSLFTGLTGLAGGFVMLLAIRFAFGVAQAGAYPTSAVLVANWVPLTARGTASSLVAVGGRVGGFVSPILTGLLIVLLAPADVPSRLGPDDLTDFPALCDRLRKEPTRLGERILAALPPDVRATVRWYAECHAAAPKQILPPTRAEVRRAVADTLNEVLRDPHLRNDPYFRTVALPREAAALLQASAAELSAERRERLNRLLLEAAYPQAIKEVYGPGWRPTMVVFGLVGLAVAGLFWVWTRDRPAQHPRCNAAEVRVIEEGRPAPGARPDVAARRVPLGPLVRSSGMWLMCLSQFATNAGWVFLVLWLPRYLAEVHRVPIEERGLLAGIPLVAGWVGMVWGGWATDRLTRAIGRRWGRALPLALSRFVAVGAYAVCLLDPGPYAATLAFAVVAFATDFGTPATWAFCLDVGGREVGSVLGWGNMWGNFGAGAFSVLLNAVTEAQGWDMVFVTCAAAFLVSGVASLGVDASKPLAPSPES
jgi:sugar phosphate permease